MSDTQWFGDVLPELVGWHGRLPEGEGFPQAKTRNLLQATIDEIEYLRFLVWKLSVRDLADQHPKYKHNLQRTFVSTREKDFGVNDVRIPCST
jgi:hypothetical protein